MDRSIVRRPGGETTRIHEKDGVVYITYKKLDEQPWLMNAFSTRVGGVSEGIYSRMNLAHTVGDDPGRVLENFRIFGKAAIGTAPEDMVTGHQTHTANVMKVDGSFSGMGTVRERSYSDVDGLMTDTPGLCLVTSYADCVPLYFADPVNRAIALSHSGWRGTVGNIARNTIEGMREAFGTDPSDVIACIGPSIGSCCYEVSEDVAEKFREAYTEEEACVILKQKKDPAGKYMLDLTMANFFNLTNSGVKEENIAKPDLCTCCNSSWLHSHRATGGKRGGMCAFLVIKK